MERRTVDEVLLAHEFDPARRELYVEGGADRRFLTYLAGADIHPDSSVHEIDEVEIGGADDSGNRTRLLAFAERVDGERVDIAYFADLDADRLNSVTQPANGWFTDVRDLEGYLFSDACFEKLAVAIGLEPGDAQTLLREIRRETRTLGFLRVSSEQQGLRLPFRQTSLRRAVSVDGRSISVDLEHHCTSLLQNADISVSRRDEVLAGAKRLEDQHPTLGTSVVMHGRDAIALLESALRRNDASVILRATFERAMVAEHPNLEQAVNYLKRL